MAQKYIKFTVPPFYLVNENYAKHHDKNENYAKNHDKKNGTYAKNRICAFDSLDLELCNKEQITTGTYRTLQPPCTNYQLWNDNNSNGKSTSPCKSWKNSHMHTQPGMFHSTRLITIKSVRLNSW